MTEAEKMQNLKRLMTIRINGMLNQFPLVSANIRLERENQNLRDRMEIMSEKLAKMEGEIAALQVHYGE